MRFSTATLNRAAGARVYGKSLESRARQIRVLKLSPEGTPCTFTRAAASYHTSTSDKKPAAAQPKAVESQTSNRVSPKDLREQWRHQVSGN